MFHCDYQKCEEKFDNIIESKVHSSYHLYHEKIKEQGGRELELLEIKFGMPIKCPLEDKLEESYCFPQLPRRLICSWSECRQEFTSAELFYNHVANHAHAIVDKCYWNGCNSTFKRLTMSLLKDHLRIHTLQKLFACPRCGSFFSTKVKFNDHILRNISVPDLLQRTLNLTPRRTTHIKDDLKYHVEDHDLEDGQVRVFRCAYDDCNKAFLSSSLLREHGLVHALRFQCDECGFKAKSESHLKSHKLHRHQTQRNYECAICSKTFKQRGDLRAHVIRHQISEPYQCHKCDFETSSEECLNKHLKLHSDPKYLCHICDLIVSRGNNLSRHLRERHNLKPPDGLSRFNYKLSSRGMYTLDGAPDSVRSTHHSPLMGLTRGNTIHED